jgi:hypothetical protein
VTSVFKPGRLQVTFDCSDPTALGCFWAAALDYEEPDVEAWRAYQRKQGRPEHELNDAFAIVDRDGVRPRLFFQRVPELKTVKNRVHLDIAAPDRQTGDRPAEIDEWVARLVDLGATRLQAVEDESGYFVVMADPEGNEFCVD